MKRFALILAPQVVTLTLAGCGEPTASGAGQGGTTSATGMGGSAQGGNDAAGGVGVGGAAGSGAGAGAGAGAGSGTGGGAGATSTGGAGAMGGAGAAGGAASTGGSGTGGSGASGPWTVVFDTNTLSTEFFSEGADVGDINGDGVVDLIAGPNWYAGPDYTSGGALFDAPSFTRDNYSTFFLTFADDLNGDTYVDVIAIGDAGGRNGSGTPNAYWYENPGPANLDQVWAKHVLFDGLVSNESPNYVNLIGDAKKELVFMTDQQLGYASPGANPMDAWIFTPVSGNDFNTPYVHGLGVGDLNGDGRFDIVEGNGWWEQPESGTGLWTHHAVNFDQGSRGGAQMMVYDVDGDMDADVVASLDAHGYGLMWFEQTGADAFTPHEILAASKGDDSFSQQHAMAAADLNGDGLLDVVTGKRYYAHPSGMADPGTDDPPVIYWFELGRDGGASFTPHLIHDDSGAGCNFTIADLSGDGRPEIFVSNKRGTFLHTQQ